MDAAQAAGHMTLFDQLHHRYERLSGLQLPLLLLLAAAATARDSAAQGRGDVTKRAAT